VSERERKRERQLACARVRKQRSERTQQISNSIIFSSLSWKFGAQMKCNESKQQPLSVCRRNIQLTAHILKKSNTIIVSCCHICTTKSELENVFILYREKSAMVDIRWFPVDGFDTRCVTRSFSCGRTPNVSESSRHDHALTCSSLFDTCKTCIIRTKYAKQVEGSFKL